jgi:outer membrane murein-binding lipoprotein Lpp
MDYQKLISNFKTLNAFLSELQNNMNSAIPEIYLKLQEQDNKEVG